MCYDMFFETQDDPHLSSTTTTTATITTHKGKPGPSTHRSVAKFYFPTPYSYRMQLLSAADTECFCFPPLSPLSSAADSADLIATEAEDDGLLGKAAKLRQELEIGLESPDFSSPWTFIFRTK